MDISPTSTSNSFRKNRMAAFLKLVDEYVEVNQSCTILDLGGTVEYWQTWGSAFDLSKVEVLCINTFDQLASPEMPNVRCVKGNACNLSDYQDQEFDIVFSNSCIEHVGGWRAMSEFASEVRRVGKSYFIQTPNFWFPIEAHARMPFIHWLPDQITYRLHLLTKAGYYPKADSVNSAMQIVEDAKLLDFNQMQCLFSDAEIRREKFMGVTKALIAVRHPKVVARSKADPRIDNVEKVGADTERTVASVG